VSTAYATAADYAAYAGAAAPADAARQLQRASDLIDSIVTVAYAVDGSGMPTSATLLAALNAAACAQVEFWTEVGEANDIDGLAGTQVSVAGFAGRRAPRIAPRAKDVLRTAGLVGPSGGGLSRVPWGTGLQ